MGPSQAIVNVLTNIDISVSLSNPLMKAFWASRGIISSPNYVSVSSEKTLPRRAKGMWIWQYLVTNFICSQVSRAVLMIGVNGQQIVPAILMTRIEQAWCYVISWRNHRTSIFACIVCLCIYIILLWKQLTGEATMPHAVSVSTL